MVALVQHHGSYSNGVLGWLSEWGLSVWMFFSDLHEFSSKAQRHVNYVNRLLQYGIHDMKAPCPHYYFTIHCSTIMDQKRKKVTIRNTKHRY